MDCVVAGRGFKTCICRNPFLPFPREGIALCLGSLFEDLYFLKSSLPIAIGMERAWVRF
jgi:hypothetical protein